ncbi:MAG: hypothetical protein M3083_24885 [Actinomycetota bacterium]|nr:hypothetical protein [Actinomycetota bacterium]MDQ6945878.1 hypothetical protein [Actinomycetota bacterium]
MTWPGVVGLHPAFQVATEAGITIPSAETIAVLRLAADSWTLSHLTA